jgi:RNA polymerase sigma factor (sigma-70 family)
MPGSVSSLVCVARRSLIFPNKRATSLHILNDMSERTDGELVEQGQRGDPTAIGELFSRYWRAARAAAFGVTAELAAAEDAAAEAFKEACAGIDSLRDPDRFGSWLRAIVVRKARMSRQSRQAPLDSLTDQPRDSGEPPDDVVERLQLEALVKQAMRELSEPLREAIALVYFEGYKSEAAASFLGIPAGTLRRRLHDGRAHLRIVVGQILDGKKPVNEERDRHLQRLRTMIESGEIYQALRGMLALRPVPSELFDLFLRQKGPASDLPGHQEMIQRLLQPSERALDPSHPVGSIVVAIQKALPDFQNWSLNTGSAIARLFSARGEYRDRLQELLLRILPKGILARLYVQHGRWCFSARVAACAVSSNTCKAVRTSRRSR